MPKEHFVASYETLLDIRYFLYQGKTDFAIDLINDTITLVESGVYPKDLSHIKHAIKKHERAQIDIHRFLHDDFENIMHVSIHDPKNENEQWIITIEKLIELKRELKKGKIESVKLFFDALFYKDYLVSTRFFMNFDSELLYKMIDVHVDYIEHLKWCIPKRRLRTLTNFKG